jgi:[ribosomal protein S18]-alanine N-acetyltransferase
VSNIALPGAQVPARAHACPGQPGMAQVVVLDGTAVATPEHYSTWTALLSERGFTRIRTGALSSRQATQAERAGLTCVQELSLLDRATPEVDRFERRTARTARTRRLRRRELEAIAAIDLTAFGPNWTLDADMLSDVRTATPVHRARTVRDGERIVGFLIAGRAGSTGYIQRLAIDPTARRRGLATALVYDSLHWMYRARTQRVYVNTHVDNDAALALYRRLGFNELPERLRVYEGPISR